MEMYLNRYSINYQVKIFAVHIDGLVTNTTETHNTRGEKKLETLARRKMESLEASYGCSFDGISRIAGIVWEYRSITCLIISATCDIN